jgi:hypothetical protein
MTEDMLVELGIEAEVRGHHNVAKESQYVLLDTKFQKIHGPYLRHIEVEHYMVGTDMEGIQGAQFLTWCGEMPVWMPSRPTRYLAKQ